MVYKITGQFDDNNLNAILKKASQCFKLLYKNQTLYIALKDYKDFSSRYQIIENIFKPKKNFQIVEISEENIMNESREIIDWCKNNLVGLDRQKFEMERQDKLKQTMLAMDNFEEILHQKFVEKCNGVIDYSDNRKGEKIQNGDKKETGQT